jgi:FkbM family methyltransferase
MTSSSRRFASKVLHALRLLFSDDPDEIKTLPALRAEVRKLRARVDRFKADSGFARERTKKLRSVAVDSHHLKSVLPLRAAALRDAMDDAAEGREAFSLSRLESYEDAKRAWTAGERPAGIRTATTAGLQWSIPADRGDDHSLSRRIERGWLPFHDIATVRACAVGGVMLDIGANIGTTCIPRVVLGDFDRVYAAEPELENYACLVGNVIDNGLTGRILPDRVAITSWDGAAALQKTDRIGGHRLIAEPGSEERLIEVPCFTIDRWLDRLGVAPSEVTFVKVDTQGWDVEVLKGATSLLAQKHIVWQIEITRMVKRSGATIKEFIDLVSGYFTHAKRLGGEGASDVRPIVELLEELDGSIEENNFTNMLLLNRA